MSMLPVVAMAAISGLAGTFNPIPEDSLALQMHHLRLLYENDAIADRDQDYTHGTRLEYLQEGLLGPEVGWGVSLTQNMYTPKTHAEGAVPGEHPYAGFMALGGILFMRDDSSGLGTAFEFQLGMTGEASGAHGVQHFVHELGGMDQWKGWDDQVPSELAIQAAQQVAYRIPGLSGGIGPWESETFVYCRYDVGTVRIAGGAGMGFRIGRNLQYNNAQVMGNRAANIGIALATKPWKNRELSYYLTGNVYAEYVAQDFAIDGGVFHHFDRTCGREPWQVEGCLGVGVTYKGIDYFMGVVGKSRSYRTQERGSVYGTFSVSWHW